jgi:hypothetical protein
VTHSWRQWFLVFSRMLLWSKKSSSRPF